MKEPAIPFPQADSVDRILNMIDYLYEKAGATAEQVTLENEFVGRQTNYYMTAMRYLGLVDATKSAYRLTPEGVELATTDIRTRHLHLAGKMLQHEVFRSCLEIALAQGEMPNRQTIVDLMKSSHLYHIDSEETYKRRSSTINSWLYWILSLISHDDE